MSRPALRGRLHFDRRSRAELCGVRTDIAWGSEKLTMFKKSARQRLVGSQSPRRITHRPDIEPICRCLRDPLCVWLCGPLCVCLCLSLCAPLCPGELTFKTSLQVCLTLRRVAPLTRPPRGPRCGFGRACRMQVGTALYRGSPDLRAAPASSLIALIAWSRMLVGQALNTTLHTLGTILYLHQAN